MIVDGRLKFAVSIDEFYARQKIAEKLARFGMFVPPAPTAVAHDAAPAVARIEPLYGVAKWHAICPDCNGSEYVWLASPRFLCCGCANKGIGGLWRPVLMPADRRAVERLLLARTDPNTRVWYPGESVEQLEAENVMLSGGGG